MIGSIRDEILNVDELAIRLIEFLIQYYPGILSNRYECREDAGSVDILGEIAANRACRLKGNELDYSKAAGIVVEDFEAASWGELLWNFRMKRKCILTVTGRIRNSYEDL